MENLPNSTLLESLLDELIENVKTYNPDGVDLIIKAYKYAAFLHDGIFRESGEPYVSHTLCVAIILSELKLDTNVICAGLLHDAIEDTDTNKDKIAELFNEDIAYLVDGVTKIRKGNFASKDEKNCANLRKLLEYAALDIRVILIKLADRLHNMRTLAHKKDQLKRIENSQETLEVYVPISYHLGLHPIKSELENLALEYTAPSEYKTISEIREDLEKKYAAELEDLLETI